LTAKKTFITQHDKLTHSVKQNIIIYI